MVVGEGGSGLKLGRAVNQEQMLHLLLLRRRLCVVILFGGGF